MIAPTSAPAQALGYFYQVSYALYLVLTGQEELSNLYLQISIEDIDDIVTRSEGELIKLLQLKQHLAENETLSDRSRDLWKTLGTWSYLLADKRISFSNKTQLFLITTAKAPKGSIASLLCPNIKRNPEEAHNQLTKIARESTKSLQTYFL